MPKETDRTTSAAQGQELLGYAVIERARDGSYDLMLGTPIFEPDDRESAEACLAGNAFIAGDAFIAEVRRV